ncbi:MAG TPA: glycosyltransferase family 4 protein [Terriglobales bacterium]|nr:glycosyltransferase family 4 protein [Terriglobales bacterium]
MRIALIAPPFISVPPKDYGGTELFIAHLAEGLKENGIEVVVYANGESTVDAEVRWIYPKAEWPLTAEIFASMKDVNHTSWAVADAARDCDLIHLNNAPGLSTSHFVNQPYVYTVHHPHENGLSEFYAHYPKIQYVTISDFQRSLEAMPNMQTIHHGIRMDHYQLYEKKQPYLSFIGRLAPVKGPDLAIEVAKKTGIPLKIAGEVQPLFKDYYESKVKPHIDGKFIEYIGEANLEEKNELLGNSMAMLFPIQWNEPFGLVMIEAMACGTPVIALRGGSVPEVVRDGVSGCVCENVEEMAACVKALALPPLRVRQYVQMNFSVQVMVKKYIELYNSILEQREPLANVLGLRHVSTLESETLSPIDQTGAAA